MYPYELTLTHQGTGETTRETDTDPMVLWSMVNQTPPGYGYVIVRLDPQRSIVTDGATY